MSLNLGLLIPVWILIGIITALIGSRKADPDERVARFTLYFLIGIILGPIGLLLASVDSGGAVTCPACRKTVSGKASICPHCRNELPVSTKKRGG